MNGPPPRTLTDAQKRKVVVGVLLAMFLATLDQTIVAPALPTIGANLGSVDFLPWIISVYLLTSTATTPLYGKVSDVYGRRPVLLLALAVFVVGSVICAMSVSMPMMIIGRAIQGLGGGGLITLAQTVIADAVSPRERSKYVVYITTVWATSSVAGPVLGGFLAQHISWSVIFWINVPLGIFAAFITSDTLRGLPQVKRNHRLDVLGSLLMTSATVALMLVLTLGGARMAWTSPQILSLTAGALLLGGWFIAHLLRAPEPLIPLDIFRNEVVGVATISIFFSMFAFVGATVYLPIYFEYAMGADPTLAGAGLIALLGGSVIGANSAGRYMPRIAHYKRMPVVGLSVAIVALALLALFAPQLRFWQAELLVLILGIGIGPLFPVATVAVQNAVDPRDLGIATATLAFLRTFGSAIGVALIGAIVLDYGVVNDLNDAGAAAFAEAGDIAVRAGHAFAVVFALQAAAVAISLICVLAMEEKPLRGPAPVAAAPEL
jgi:EmrB/QacA subfamily drug resistance transporter